jgi:ubiquinone/menaquinone biosynthesis C-methylase UbiE
LFENEGGSKMQRVQETDQGIQGEFTVAIYDRMQRRFRDKGWMETQSIIKSGIRAGEALEVGSGPGYLGLEWLKSTQDTSLTGLDISPDMITVARRNAAEYGFAERARYVPASGAALPFGDGRYDAAFSNGSLHEWSEAKQTLDEMWRVLKPSGKLFLSDLRRDMLAPVKWFMWVVTKPKEIRPGLITSIRAAYTPAEVEAYLAQSKFENFKVFGKMVGVHVVAVR